MFRVALNGLGLASALVQAISSPRASAAGAAPVRISVPTFHYDNQRTGWNPNEPTLTPAVVRRPGFGPVWSSPPLDSVTVGNVTYPPHLYATPLYMDDVPITAGSYRGQRFSVLFAATTNDFVYAINAFDVPGPPKVPAGTILWTARLGAPTDFGLDGGGIGHSGHAGHRPGRETADPLRGGGHGR
jgi:hypothetical protein